MIREHGRLRRPERFFAGFAHVAFPAEMPHAQNLQKSFRSPEATMLTDHPARLNENIASTAFKAVEATSTHHIFGEPGPAVGSNIDANADLVQGGAEQVDPVPAAKRFLSHA